VRLGALLLAGALASPAATYFLTISGLGAEPDYEQRFKMWAMDIDSSLKKAAAGDVVTLIAPNREQIRARFQELARTAKPEDALVVMLIGHGTDDGVEYKFNIPGPDITAAELAVLLDRVPAARQCVAVMTSSSGGAIALLRRANRIVITATKTGTEKNATVFARYWADALRDPAADTDKNDAVSVLEAFAYAQHRVAESFDSAKHLATEHSLLEDTGKGDGERNPSPENGEGRLAAAFTLVRLGANADAARDPARRALLAKKDALEQAIDQLKYEKAGMDTADYRKQLTQLLLELAKTQEALDAAK
jgi:hypothetical protein